jgi:hypothetical protein
MGSLRILAVQSPTTATFAGSCRIRVADQVVSVEELFTFGSSNLCRESAFSCLAEDSRHDDRFLKHYICVCSKDSRSASTSLGPFEPIQDADSGTTGGVPQECRPYGICDRMQGDFSHPQNHKFHPRNRRSGKVCTRAKPG